VLLHPKGSDLVMEIARQANRFRLRDIQVDILKGLYESLIDPEQRHDLGEYYTPDWLADRICRAAIHDPLAERVIDPACGSGTFLFHAIRRLLTAAEGAGISPADAVTRAEEKIAGIDVHPVAVMFARATYLLALMPALAKGRPGSLSVPVYLGDALQWNAREFMNLHDLEIVVPAPGEAARAQGGTISVEESRERVILRFPMSLASEPGLFNETLEEMLNLAGRHQPASSFTAWLARRGITHDADVRMLQDTYEAFRALQAHDRNHIWGYVARNLSRPIWLATEQQEATW
jgi:N-6 DNA Methylase